MNKTISESGAPQPPAWAQEQISLRHALEQWITTEIDRYEAQGFARLFGDKGGHKLDEAGGYTRSFVSAYCLNGDPRIARFLKRFRDDWLAAVNRDGHFYHGYDANENADYVTHTAEAFTQFLLNVFYLDITDATSIAIIEDAAEHLGNWNPDVPPWYDWDRHVFRGYFPGTRTPSRYFAPPFDFQSSSHFRLLAIATAAFEATGKARYLDLCRDYWTAWNRKFRDTPPDQPAPLAFKQIDAETIRRHAAQPEIMNDWRFHRYYAAELAALGLGEGPPSKPWRLPAAYHQPHDLMMTLLDVLRLAPDTPGLREGLRRIMGDWIAVYADRQRMIGVESIGSLTKPGDLWCGLHLPKYRDITGDTGFDGAYLEHWPIGPCGYLLDGDPRRLTGVAASAEAAFRQTLARNRGEFGPAFINTHSCDRRSNAFASTAVMPALFSVAMGGLGVHFGRAPWLNLRYFTDGKPGLPPDVAARYVPAGDGRQAAAQLVNLGNRPRAIGVQRIDPAGTVGLVLTEPMPPDAETVRLEPQTCRDVTFT